MITSDSKSTNLSFTPSKDKNRSPGKSKNASNKSTTLTSSHQSQYAYDANSSVGVSLNASADSLSVEMVNHSEDPKKNDSDKKSRETKINEKIDSLSSKIVDEAIIESLESVVVENIVNESLESLLLFNESIEDLAMNITEKILSESMESLLNTGNIPTENQSLLHRKQGLLKLRDAELLSPESIPSNIIRLIFECR